MFLKFSRLLYSIPLLFLVGCSEKEADPNPDFVKYDLSVFLIEEKFDAEGSLSLTAKFSTLKSDTIKTFGFIYTDGLNGDTGSVNPNVDPRISVDHVINSTTLVPDGKPSEGLYTFEATINPKRVASTFASNTGVVNVAAYAVSTSGKTRVSQTARIAAAKLAITDIFPLYAKAGEQVKLTLNRMAQNGAISSSNLVSGPSPKTNSYPVQIKIGNTVVTEVTNTNYDFAFKMPSNVSTESPITVTAGSFEMVFSQNVKNTERAIQFLTEYKRDFLSAPLIFALGNNVYFGGGSSQTNANTTLTDFWKYDMAANAWSAIANYPSDGKGSGMVFTNSGKAYCGNPDYLSEYDAATNKWKKLALPTTLLQYNHTFSQSAAGVVNGKAYFTNFHKEVTVGIFYNNFNLYDIANGTYSPLVGYPGTDIFSDFSDKAVAVSNILHFFPGLQHWTYNPSTQLWTKLNDVTSDGTTVKPFTFNGDLYAIQVIKKTVNFFVKWELRVLKYNSAIDGWARDSDVPVPQNFSNIYPLTSDNGSVFICATTYSPYRIIVHKLL
jgi:hypothetical protein